MNPTRREVLAGATAVAATVATPGSAIATALGEQAEFAAIQFPLWDMWASHRAQSRRPQLWLFTLKVRPSDLLIRLLLRLMTRGGGDQVETRAAGSACSR